MSLSPRHAVLGITSLAAAFLAVTWAFAQEKDAKKAAAPAPPAGAGDWAALTSPGEAHRRLERLVGEWDAVMKIWMAGPDAPPSESKGTMKSRWVLGKRYLADEFKGEMVMPDATGKMVATPFEGMGLTGHDNIRNLYVGTWADSMGTQILNFSGTCDAAGQVFTYYGVMDEPGLNVIGRMVKYETRIADDNHHTFAIFDLNNAATTKVLEISYTRKKP